MTASIANGFGHVLYTPNSPPARWSLMRSTPSTAPRTRAATRGLRTRITLRSLTKSAISRTASKIDANFNCAVPGNPGRRRLGPGRRQQLLRPEVRLTAWSRSMGASPSTGTSTAIVPQRLAGHRSRTSPRTGPSTRARVVHQSAVQRGTTDYSTIAFETDLPRIERRDSQVNPPFCDRTTGADCVNPPSAREFYPIYSTTVGNGTCTWQEGGPFIPGTTNDFGGSSTTEYGLFASDGLSGRRVPQCSSTTTSIAETCRTPARRGYPDRVPTCEERPLWAAPRRHRTEARSSERTSTSCSAASSCSASWSLCSKEPPK